MTEKHTITHIKAKERMIETDKTNIAQNTGLQDCVKKSSLEFVKRLSKLHPCNKTKKKTNNINKHHNKNKHSCYISRSYNCLIAKTFAWQLQMVTSTFIIQTVQT